jgi:hypothetical protein
MVRAKSPASSAQSSATIGVAAKVKGAFDSMIAATTAPAK